MKKALSLLLSLLMVAGNVAFAVPTTEQSQQKSQQAVTASQDAVLAAETVTTKRGSAPGLNIIGQTASAWNFETTDTLDMGNSSLISTWPTKGVSVADNPLKDTVNGSDTALELKYNGSDYTSDCYASVEIIPDKTIESDRPILISFKYYKTYEKASEDDKNNAKTQHWVMKNGATFIAHDIGGFTADAGWKSYSKLIDFNKAYKAGDNKTIDTNPISRILIEFCVGVNKGTTKVYYDDISAIPSYKVTYMSNDESNTKLKSEYVLLDANGKLLESYTPLESVKPEERYKYEFLGWSTAPDASEPMATVPLENKDIVLYAVWKEDTSLPDKATVKWDFETEDTRTWAVSNGGYTAKYENGMYIVDTTGRANNSYIAHKALGDDVVKNTKALKYLVVKARSKGTDNNIKFYFSTTTQGASEKATVNFKIDPQSKVFKEYYVDMSKNECWTGDYKSCMLQLNGGKGVTEIEEIYFTTDYKPAADTEAVDKIDIPLSCLGGAWGNVTCSNNVLTRTEANGQGAAEVKFPDGVSVLAKTYPIIVFKCSENTLDAISFYWQTDEEPSPSETKKTTATPVIGDDGYTYFVADVGSSSSATAKYGKFMISPIGDGKSAKVEEIFLATKFEVNEPQNYVWDFEDGTATGIKAWSGHTSIAVEDGKLSITRVQSSSSSGGIDIIPQETLSASGHPYLVFKIAKDEAGSERSFQVYYVTGSMGGIAGSAYVHTTSKASDDKYYYAVADFTSKSDYASGNIKQYVVAPTTLGTVKVEEIIVATDLSFISTGSATPKKEVEKMYLNVSANKITTDHGTVTISPYIRYTDGSEETDLSDVAYITDSVVAQVQKNADGTATVTAQQNGTVNITIVMPDGVSTLSTAITITGQPERIAANSFKVMMFGNSIRAHGYAESIGWYGQGWGMAASAEDKDYAHRFIYYMNKKYGDGVATLTPHGTPAGFEAAAAAAKTYDPKEFETYVNGFLSLVNAHKPDIITIQLGENGGEAQSATVYTKVMTQVIKAMQEAVPNAVIVISTPFWSGNTSNKVTGTYAAAEECGIRVAPVNTLGATAWNADNKNMAFDAPWKTDKTSDGVLAHPGDTGMDNIAKMFFEQVNVTLSANERTEYTTVPESVNITVNGDAKITKAFGTLKLSATVLPSDAAQTVEWRVDNKDLATIDENGLLTAINDGTVTVRATSKFVSTVYGEIEVEISGQTKPHTITYDKNTDDTVTNMPKANNLAKENFIFDSVYPVRSTYKFLGWSLNKNGTADDVIEKLDVTADTTVYAIWEKAHRWSFDRPGYKEEFTVENGFNEYVLNGYFTTIATGTDLAAGAVLKIKSPLLDLRADDYYALVLTMKSSEPAKTSTVEMTIKATGGNKTFKVGIPNNEYNNYEFKLDGISGTITGFEFKPTDVDTTIYLDNISFEEEPFLGYIENAGDDAVTGMPASEYTAENGKISVTTATPSRPGYTFLGWSISATSKLLVDETVDAGKVTKLYAIWDKNDHWEMDDDVSSVGNSTNWETKDGILEIFEDGNSNDITVNFKKDMSYDVATTSKKLVSRIKFDFENAGQHQQLFFMTSDSPNLSEANSGHGANYGTAKVDEFFDYTVDLSGKSNFSGKLKGFRWDPFQCQGTFYADYFRFSDSEANILTSKDETRKLSLSDDWGTYIVKTGGTLAPNGEIIVKNLALSGDIDMANGYIIVTGNAEFAESSAYTLYTVDMKALGANADSYMYISGYDKPVKMTDGAKYVVKLDENGIGTVVIGNDADSDKHSVILVGKGTEKNLPELVTKIRKERFVRVSDPESIRFTASVALEARNADVESDGYEVAEYGFLVSTEKQIAAGNELTLSAVKAGKAVKGVAYNGKNGSVDLVNELTEDCVVMSAVLKNMPETKEAYTTKLYLRPYVLLTNGDAVYGAVTTDSVYDSAKLISLTMTEEDEYYDYISGIIELCK